MDRLFDEDNGAANDTSEGTCFNKFNIRLRTACGQITELAVIQSYTIQKVIYMFLDNRNINPSCDRMCCPTQLAYVDLKLSFECDIFQPDKSLQQLGIESDDVIDVLHYETDKAFSNNWDKRHHNEFKISLRTCCGAKSDLLVFSPMTIEKVIHRYLEYRQINSFCDSMCCPAELSYSDVILRFDGDLLQHNKTLDELDLQCSDLIDVHIRDNLT